MRIVVAGRFAGVPRQGGATWAVLQYVLGFRQLGHDVLLIEPCAADPAVVQYFGDVVRASDLGNRVALMHPDATTTGLAADAVRHFCATADLLVNLAGVLRDPELVTAIPLRVYVDVDPAFTQLWHASDGIDMNLDGHHRHVTYGLAIGTASCDVPTCGISWITTLPPVVLDHWPFTPSPPLMGLTTVANWRSYGCIRDRGRVLGQKAHSVRALLDLPAHLSNTRIEPAIGLHPGDAADIAALDTHGWAVQDPATCAGDPSAYRAFVRSSFAELGVAKSGYVLSRCGWFSDRSACYLACGRPVIAQETGWSDHLPSGEGLMTFHDSETAALAVAELRRDENRHRRSARRIAEEHFDSRVVLARFLAEVGAT
jgi:hypothetical protein